MADDVIDIRAEIKKIIEHGSTLALFVKQIDLSEQLDPIIGEFGILRTILVETMTTLLDQKSKPRASAMDALKRCGALQGELLLLLGDGSTKKSRFKSGLRLLQSDKRLRIDLVFNAFKSAVLLFREISIDSLNHDLLREVHKARSEDAVQGSSAPGGSILFNATISHLVDTRTESTSDQSSPSPCSTCPCGRERSAVFFPVRGKFDSQSHTNFASMNVLKRGGFDPFIEVVPPTEVKMSDESITLERRIKLNWHLENDQVSYTSNFWIVNGSGFDILVGEPWLMSHGGEQLNGDQARKKILGHVGGGS